MEDLRDNELSSLDDSSPVNVVNVNATGETKTKSTAKNVSVCKSNEVKNVESTESKESKKSNEVESKNLESNEVENMDDLEDASQSILQDVVINQCEERPPPVSSGSASVSFSVSGSGPLVHKRGLADPLSERTAQNKKELSCKAGKSSSSKASSSSYPLGAAKHVGLPFSVSAVPPHSRIC